MTNAAVKAEPRGNPKFTVRLPEGIIALLDQACGGEKQRQAFIIQMIETYCTPEAERERQATGTYDEGLRRGRMQGQRYAEMAYWLKAIADHAVDLTDPLPGALAQWRHAYPADWAKVQLLLLNSPAAAQFAQWHAVHAADTP